MPNEMLNEDIQNLFRDLLLQKDIESERRLLQENGIDVDDKDLEEFHKKKEALFDFAKKNKDKLQKLDVSDMYAVSGGWKLFDAEDVVDMLVYMFLAYVQNNSVPIAALISVAKNLVINLGKDFYERYNEELQDVCNNIDLSSLEGLI